MADIITSSSGYATGDIDTATVLVNNVSPTDAGHINGPATAIIQLETALGTSTTLIGTHSNLGARLAVSLASDGHISSTGAADITDSDSRTNTSDVMLTLASTTSGTPAAGIGTDILLRAESADENPSDVVQFGGAFSDVTAGSEDSYFRVLVRVGGAALSEAYRWAATTANKAIFTHANSADRTYTLPDHDGTIATIAGSQTITNKTIDSNDNTITIHTDGLATATGSAALAAASTVNVALNAYAFFPNIQLGTLTSPGTNCPVMTHTGNNADEVGRILVDTGANAAGSGHVRWRYITASDDPTMWVVYDPLTGEIKAVWASDDPVPNNEPGVRIAGFPSIMMKAQQLEHLSALNARAADAMALIRDRRLKPIHQAYRALQLVTNDTAPSRWLFNNCVIGVNGWLQMRPNDTPSNRP